MRTDYFESDKGVLLRGYDVAGVRHIEQIDLYNVRASKDGALWHIIAKTNRFDDDRLIATSYTRLNGNLVFLEWC